MHGCDFNIFKNLYVTNSNELMLKFDHFYGTKFEPVYKNKKTQQKSSIAYEMKKWNRFFVFMEGLAYHLEKKGKKVINYSADSMVQVFPRNVFE